MNEGQTHPATENAEDFQLACERLSPSRDLVEYFRQYARERPEVVALCCLGVGFVLGWKMKLW